MSARTLVAAGAGALAGVLAFGVLIAVNASRLGPGPAERADDVGQRSAATAAASPSVDAPFAVWAENSDGTPVRWDPCTPIRWVLDDALAPVGARELVGLAMERITAASGIEFEYVGPTDEQPGRDRPLLDADGENWAPVFVGWIPGSSTDLPLGDDERGVTIPVAVRDGGPRVFVTGQLLLNSDKTLLPGFEDRHASWGAVVMHEVGHLVGLDHVQDARQLMHPTPGFGPVRLGPGDEAGLAVLGADGGCLETPAPQELPVDFG